MSKIIIIGGNHAGTATANTILDNYKGNEVIVIERNTNISFLGCGMALWIGDQIDGSDGLFYMNKEGFEKKGATVYMETEVTDIDFDKKMVIAKDANGKIITENYDKVIFATGSLPIIPKLPGSDLENIQKVKLFQDAQAVIDKLKIDTIKNVAVIGAGYIGVELAEAFKRKGKKTTMIDIAQTCLPGYYDNEFTDAMKQNLIDNGIELVFGSAVEGFEGNGKVEKVLTSTQTVEADMVIWAVGFRPNTDLAKETLQTFTNGAYLVNTRQETSVQDVYAVGDCATIKDNSVGDINYIALATNAVRSGIVAAHNACGTTLDSIGVQGSNGISVFGLNMVSTGLTYAKAIARGLDVAVTDFEDFQKPQFMKTENEKVKLRIVFEKKTRRIVGAQMMSRLDISMGIHMFSLAIQENVTIDKLKLLDVFFLPHFNMPYNYITMAALSAPNT
ncbi:MAG: FAD-dependent oxidoreductase [Spirochaetales bacterium]